MITIKFLFQNIILSSVVTRITFDISKTEHFPYYYIFFISTVSFIITDLFYIFFTYLYDNIVSNEYSVFLSLTSLIICSILNIQLFFVEHILMFGNIIFPEINYKPYFNLFNFISNSLNVNVKKEVNTNLIIIETNIIANCNICLEDNKIIIFNEPFNENCSCSRCNFTLCKECFHSIININDNYKCAICKKIENISSYINSSEYLNSIKLDYENYNLVVDDFQLIFKSKTKYSNYIVDYNNLFLSSKYNISLLTTNESDIEMSWNFDKFRFIKKFSSNSLFILYYNSNVSFIIEDFEYTKDQFQMKFNIFGNLYKISYKKFITFWISSEQYQILNDLILNQEIFLDDLILKDFFEFWGKI